MKVYNLIFLFLLLLSSCILDIIEPDNKLPGATQEGKNTFGCLINGEVWKPTHCSLMGSVWTGTRNCHITVTNNSHYSPYLIIEAFKFKYKKVNQDFRIVIETLPRSTATFDLGLNHFQNYHLDTLTSFATFSNDLTTEDKTIYNEYSTTEDYVGQITISYLDTLNRIISGTFYFDAINDSGEVVEIRDGRFDLKY